MTVRISSVNDFQVPLTTLYHCVDIHDNHIGSQINTHIHTARGVIGVPVSTGRGEVKFLLLKHAFYSTFGEGKFVIFFVPEKTG